MRVNVYAEEMTDRIEIIAKEIDGHSFTGLRIYLELPVTLPGRIFNSNNAVERGKTLQPAFGEHTNVAGPFMHRPGDDDSSAVTFWGKHDLREVLRKALAQLDAHYAAREPARNPVGGEVPGCPERKRGDGTSMVGVIYCDGREHIRGGVHEDYYVGPCPGKERGGEVPGNKEKP